MVHPQIKRQQEFVQQAQLDLQLTVRDQQIDCWHFDLSECDHLLSEQVGEFRVEQRMCNTCLIREYASDHGFIVLDQKARPEVMTRPPGSVGVKKISRHELLTSAMGAVVHAFDKPLLLSGKITLQELIRQQLA